jgi:hypothetical protein
MGFPHFVGYLSVLCGYQKKGENRIWFLVGSKFETLGVSHWEMPSMKHGCRVLCNVKIGLLKH